MAGELKKANIKVAHICGKMGPGGIESWLNNIFKQKIDGVEFVLICMTNSIGVFDENISQNGVKIYYVKHTLKSPLKNLAAINKILKKESVNVLHLHRYKWNGVYSLFKFLGYKIINHSHNKGHDGNLKSIRSSWMDKGLIYSINRFSDKTLACSTEAAQGMFYKWQDTVVLPYGVDFESFASTKVINPGRIEILQVGRFVKFKNHLFTLEIAKRLLIINPEKYHITLVGAGAGLDEIKGIIDTEKITNVSIKPPVLEVYKYYQQSDIFILPSLNEGLGIVALEAQAAGLYTIISDNVPRSVIVSDEICTSLELDLDKWMDAIVSFEKLKINKVASNDKLVNSEYGIKKGILALKNVYGDLI